MNNLNNRKFIKFKNENAERIRKHLRFEFINDLIVKEYIEIRNDETEYILHQSGYSFYFGYELDEYDGPRESLIKVFDGDDVDKDIYVVEGTLLDKEEDIVSYTLNEMLDRFIGLVMFEGYTAPSRESICKVYDYFLNEYMFKTLTI